MKIAAILATHNRSLLLRTRSLQSILLQRRKPDFLVVVDDSDDKSEIKANTHTLKIAEAKIQFTKVFHYNTKGGQGAAYSWNFAVEKLLDLNIDTEELFIAFLDDDDSWDGDYLYLCGQKAESEHFDLIASHFYRLEENSRTYCESPQSLDVDDFIVTNPGIQGSNLFIRMKTFLEAGCFDENLPSCTDRDLCIRLAEMGNVRYSSFDKPLMNHYADSNRNRLSTPHSMSKDSGLYQFWLKYSKRMSENQKEAFLARAKKLFDWTMPQKVNAKDTLITENFSESKSYDLCVGVICSDYSVIHPLLEQLDSLQNENFIKSLKLVLLENQLKKEDKQKISTLCLKKSIRTIYIAEDMQKCLFGSGFFLNFHKELDKMATIAHARSMLQKYLGKIFPNDGACWILDEDMQLTSKTIKALRYLPKVKESGVDILIGQYENSSPNPPINGIRVQLVDFLSNLKWLCSRPDNELLPNYSSENKAFRKKYPDYYYDLSRKHKGHLEHPCWLTPQQPSETISSALNRMLDNACSIFFGNPLTRPLITEESVDFMNSLKDSVNRGGSTIVFNSKALSDAPNISFQMGGIDVRRSDMIWCIINKYYRGMIIKAGNLSTWHAGKVIQSNFKMDFQKIRDEIVGSGFYVGLTEFLEKNPNHTLNFSTDEAKYIGKRIVSHINKRMCALKQTFFRARGISASLKNTIIYREDSRLSKFVKIIDEWFDDSSYKEIEKQCSQLKRNDIESFLLSLCKSAENFKQTNIGRI